MHILKICMCINNKIIFMKVDMNNPIVLHPATSLNKFERKEERNNNFLVKLNLRKYELRNKNVEIKDLQIRIS